MYEEIEGLRDEVICLGHTSSTYLKHDLKSGLPDTSTPSTVPLLCHIGRFGDQTIFTFIHITDKNGKMHRLKPRFLGHSTADFPSHEY